MHTTVNIQSLIDQVLRTFAGHRVDYYRNSERTMISIMDLPYATCDVLFYGQLADIAERYLQTRLPQTHNNYPPGVSKAYTPTMFIDLIKHACRIFDYYYLNRIEDRGGVGISASSDKEDWVCTLLFYGKYAPEVWAYVEANVRDDDRDDTSR